MYKNHAVYSVCSKQTTSQKSGNRYLRAVIVLILLFSQVFYLHATVQSSDLIIYNGNSYPLIVTFPMESYFIEFPEKRPPSPHSALWRGYIASFEIIQNELWVIDIEWNNIFSNVRGYQTIIGELFGVDRIKIDWYSGFLVIPQGERIDYESVSWDLDYENYLIIEIENGNVINEYLLAFAQYSVFFEEQLRERYIEIFQTWNNINFPVTF